MTKKKKTLILTIIVVLIIITVFLLVIKKNNFSQKNLPAEETEKEKTEEIEEKKQAAEDPITALKTRLTLQARFFIERYGTYSSDSNYNNRKAMENQMTKILFARVMEEISLESPSVGFYSLETKVINLELKEFSEEEIVFLASAQERETKLGQRTVAAKTIELTFLKEGDDWKVDEINNR